ncbi:MAG: extracellular solute-binding protein [Dactylosporangium sp.]|nr:extracellular solute-binding protein [Dactylosporangium sp.]NNJ63887.1 extracellular solute-binding protein [Dactylosporangium sp.]
MSNTARRLRTLTAVGLVAGLALGAAACSKDDEDGGSDGTTKVVLQYFGTPGFEEAVKAFETANPEIKVDVQNMGQLKDFEPKLVQWLAAGSGAGDVVMLEEGTLLGYLENHEKFADLLELGADELKDDFLPYKWEGGFTSDKKKLVGLGTDIGGLALCYRTDLFAEAGLPTDRDEVSAKLKTWDDYVAVGKQFAASPVAAKAQWLDSATSIMQPYIMQNADTWFYDKDNTFIGDTNPVVKQAWDFGLQMAADGLTGKLTRWDADWTAAYKNAAFATVPCPAWYTGVIESNAGEEASGKWDIATIPGGSGNWGGSYLAIPEQSKVKEQAYELAKYLTSKEGELAEYEAVGAMPSNTKALADPAFADSTNEYFNNAPTGKIFGESVTSLEPIYLGPKHQKLWENVYEPAMQSAEQGKASAEDAWTKATADGKKLAEG